MTAPEPRKHAWEPGRRVGRYVILGHLASGGMAELFLARPIDDPTGRRLVVLKRINDEFSADDEFARMFLDEARIGVHLTHPHLVRTYGLDRDGASPYLALEYLSGESLQDIIEAADRKRTPLPTAYVARWVADAATGLHYAHLARSPGGEPLGIVHRDISPHNLFITYRGKLKVIDFGIAKATIKSTHTQTGYVKGKLAYLSPEQVSQATVDGRTDVFALGIVLFEALTLTPLFPDSISDGEIVEALSGSDPLDRVRDRNPKVPPGLDRIVARAMSMDLGQRYPTAEALQQALEQWLSAERQEPSGDALGDYVRRLFPERVERKDALIRSSLSADSRRNSYATDEPTATDLDLVSHPELLKLTAPRAPKAPTTEVEMRATGGEGTGATHPTGNGLRHLGRGFWLRMCLVGLAAFALTVIAGSRLTASPKGAPGSAKVRIVVPAGAEMLLDGSPYDPHLPVATGHHHLVARLDGAVRTEDFDLEPGDDREVRLSIGGAQP